MTDEDKMAILEHIDNVEDVRFIQLIVKDNYRNDINFYSGFYNLNITNDCSVIDCDFKSKFVLIPLPNPITLLRNKILKKLITNPIDSLHGISVVTEHNMGNPIMLNSKKMQYYANIMVFNIIIRNITE